MRWSRSNPNLCERIRKTLQEIYKEFGLKARISAPLIGRYIHWALRREAKRLEKGWSYEPPTFYEVNEAMRLLRHPNYHNPALIKYVGSSLS